MEIAVSEDGLTEDHSLVYSCLFYIQHGHMQICTKQVPNSKKRRHILFLSRAVASVVLGGAEHPQLHLAEPVLK